MHSSTIAFKTSTIHYSYGGDGKNLLLCFHGYGESEKSFHFLEKYLPPSYFLIAIDMPYHGETVWKEGMNFTMDDLENIILVLQDKHNFLGQPFSMLAFSMGGRIALSILQRKQQQVSRLILLAPDGLVINFWYWLSTQTHLGNKLFLATIHKPGWFLKMVKLSNRLGLLNQSIYKFVDHFLHDKKKRKQLYLRWTCFRKIKPDLAKLKESISQYKIPVHLVYGKHDRIIVASRGEKFKTGIEPYCTLESLNCGHQVLHEKNIDVILRYLPH